MRPHPRRLAAGAALAALVVLGVLGGEAEATTQTGSFVVSTQVYSGCTFTTNNLLFAGLMVGQTSPSSGQTTFLVSCPGVGLGTPARQLPVTFTMSTGPGVFSMQDQASPRRLPYQLCNDAACSQIYADSVPGPLVPVSSSSFTYNLYGQALPPASGALKGNFKQTVNVTLTY